MDKDFYSQLEATAEYLKPFALHLTNDSHDAMDLVQETIYRALANKDKYYYGTNINAWLYTIMRNIFINDRKKRSRYTFLLDPGINQITHGFAEPLVHAKEISYAIHKLPELFRCSFLLYSEGYKYNEISDLLKEPLGTIKSRIHFARKLLKGQISRN